MRLLNNGISQWDQIAIKDDKGNQFTYGQLNKESELISEYIERNSIIFILCDHQMETVKFIYEVLYSGRVPLLISEDINNELLENLVNIYRPQYIYCLKTLKFIRKVWKYIDFHTHVLLKTESKAYHIHPDLALLLSTSGTTGSAKLVKISYENLYDNIEHVCQRLDIKSAQRGISPLPLNHIFGLDFCLWHWHRGATLLITEESAISRHFHDFYIEENVNNFAATPYMYKILDRVRFWDPLKIKYLHMAMSAGEQMSKEQQAELVSLMGNKFWISYGQTECSYMITTMNFEKQHLKLASVGKPLDNIKLSIDDKNSEIIVESKSVCMGYANNPMELVEGDINGGIIHTGDKAYMDGDGCIYLKGRLSRYIKILGKRVSLDDIEKYLNTKFKGIEFACAGSDDSIKVFHTSTIKTINNDVAVWLNRKLKIPHKFVTCFYKESIPRSKAGKVLYAELET